MTGAPASCKKCPALVACRSNVVNGRGAGSRVLFVGQNPGETEDDQGKCFVGRAGQVLGSLVRLSEISLQDSHFTNAVRCWSPGNRQPKRDEIENCRPYLQEEIAELRPDLIVALGAVALESVYEKMTLGSVVGQTLYYDGEIPIVPTYHPAAVMRNWALAPLVLTHFEKARRILSGTQPQEDLGIYTPIKSIGSFREIMPQLLDPPQGFLSIDVETAAFNGPATEWKDAEILMISLSVGPGQGYAIPILGQGIETLDFWDGWYPELVELVGEVLSSDVPKALQNGSFDIRFLERSTDQPWVSAVTAFGWRVENLKHDTMLLHKALHEEMPRESKPNELERLIALYTGMPNYWADGRKKSKNKAHLELLDNEELWADGAADADAVSRLVPSFREELEEEGMGWVMDNITIPLVRSFQNMTTRGILIDRPYFDKLCDYYDGLIRECEQELFSYVGEFNPSSPVQVQEVLHKKLGLPKTGRKTNAARECPACIAGEECVKHDATDKAALEELWNLTQHPFVECFMRHRSLTKTKGTYLNGSRKKLEEGEVGGFARHIKADGRIHAEFKVGGAETGRGSAANPPVQTPPKEVEIEEWGEDQAFRTAFTAPEGFVFMEADWSQLEVWTNAYLADDQDFLNVLFSGQDIHTYVARRIEWPHLQRLGHPFPVDPDINDTEWRDVHSDLRRRGKDLVFGSQYGLTVAGVEERMNCDEEEGKRILDLYFDIRPRLRAYIDWIRETILSGEPLRTPFGRRFRFPQIPILRSAQQGASKGMWRMCQNEIEAACREGINRPTQSSGSDLHSLSHIWTEHTPVLEGRFRPNLNVHDSVAGEAYAPDREYVVETAWKIKDNWQRIAKDTVLPSGERLGWEIPVEVSWGPNWGNLHNKITARGDLVIDGELATSPS